MRTIAADLALNAFLASPRPRDSLTARSHAIAALGDTIRQFALEVSTGAMGRPEARQIAGILRIVRYLEEGARLVRDAGSLRRRASRLGEGRIRRAIEVVLDAARLVLDQVAHREVRDADLAVLHERLTDFELAYRHAKEALLEAGAAHRIEISELDRLLDDLRRSRRMVEQFAKSLFAIARLQENGGGAEPGAAARQEEAAVSQARRAARATRR